MTAQPPAATEIVAPSRADPFVAGPSRLIGGRWGRFARGRSYLFWTPMRILLVLTVLTSVLGFLAKAPCRTHAWTDEYQYTRICYTDVYALYFAEGLGAKVNAAGDTVGRVSVPYRDHPVEYPAVIGGLMWTAAEITNAVHPNEPKATANGVIDGRAKTFFDVTALMLAIGALLTTYAVARLAGRRRIWDAAMFALAPTLLLHIDTNWDLAAVALAMLGLWAWSRWRSSWVGPALAGVFIGVGTATKLYPALLLVVLLFLCLRAGRIIDWLVCAGTTLGSFVIAYLPAVLLSRSFAFPDANCPTHHAVPGWEFFWRLNTTRPADWDSLWFQVQHLPGSPLSSSTCGKSPTTLNALVAGCTVLVVLLVGLLVFLARRRPRVPQIAFLLIAGFLLVNKVDSPQYVLWLVPLAVLARPRWPAFLVWQATEVLLLFARFYFFVGNDAAVNGRAPEGIPLSFFFVSVGVRDIALAVLMGLVVRDVLKPEHDVVRADGVDDPTGGILDGAPDAWSIRRVEPVGFAHA